VQHAEFGAQFVVDLGDCLLKAATTSARCPGMGEALTTATTLMSDAFLALGIIPSLVCAVI
jgi:hypothetical protein